MRRQTMSRNFAVAALLLSGCITIARGQVTTGTILGQVADNTGAGVAGAIIQITNVGQGATKQFTTEDNGLYNAPFLIPGTNGVSVEKQGFKKALREGIVVTLELGRFPRQSAWSPARRWS